MKLFNKIYERSNKGGLSFDVAVTCRWNRNRSLGAMQNSGCTTKQNKQTNKLGNKEASKEPSKKRMNQANKQINKQMQFKVVNAHHNPVTPVHQTPYNRQ